MAHSGYAELLVRQCQLVKLPTPVLELRFAPPRRWRFDLAFEAERLAVEVDGGIWKGGRHNRGQGYENDCVKFAEAVIRGWRVLRVTTGQVKSGVALGFVERALKQEVVHG